LQWLDGIACGCLLLLVVLLEALAESQNLSERKGFRGPGVPVSEADWMPGTA